MVHKTRADMNEIFVQALYLDDHVMLKAILEGMKYTKINHLQSLLNAKDELGGFTPFEFVCLQGNAAIASMLIDTGVDINKFGQYNWTPLHAAAYSGDAKTVQVLINSCADCFANDENNNVPLDLTKDTHIRKILSEKMKEKNLEKFNAIISENCNSLKIDRFQRRSKSCFANISLIKMSELKNQLIDRKNSNEINDILYGELKKLSLKKWNTYSDLSLDTIFDLKC